MNGFAHAQRKPTVMTIAGFDPSGGAGIIVDATTIAELGCRPVAALSALTFQNSQEVFGTTPETAESLRAQVLPILSEHSIAGLKIGLLPTAEIVFEVARLIAEFNLSAPVIDPVIQASSGFNFIDSDVVDSLLTELVPVARVVTPNIPEAEKLTTIEITNEQAMAAAAQELRRQGARAVLIKGGHLPQLNDGTNQGEAIDLLDDEGRVTIFRGEWIDGPSLRGTGCRLSSAIAAGLAKGLELEEAVREAREFVADAIRKKQNREITPSI